MNRISMIIGDAKGSINNSVKDVTGKPQDAGAIDGTIEAIIYMVIGLVGTIAAIMIVLGGVQYAASQGDPGKVKKAKDTIMYGIIGMIVALVAFAVVSFALGMVFG